MAQITGVGFSNFRVFEKDTFFDLAPITIFTGTNSSGKSSVFKGLKLLKDNNSAFQVLNFSGEGHKLGTFSLSKNFKAESDDMQFSVGLDLANDSDGLLRKVICFFNYTNSNPTGEHGYLGKLFIAIGDVFKETYLDEEIFFNSYEVKENNDLVFFNFKYLLNNLNKNRIAPLVKRLGDQAASSENNKVICISSIKGVDDYLIDFHKSDYELILFFKLQESAPNLAPGSLLSVQEELQSWLINYFSYSAFDQLQYIYDNRETLSRNELINDHIKKFTQSSEFYKSLDEVLVSEILDVTDLIKGSLPSELTIGELMNPAFIKICSEIFAPVIQNIFNAYSDELNKLGYIEAVRANSQRLYSNQSQGTSFNELLLKIGDIDYLGNDQDFHQRSPKTFLEKWLKIFGVGDEIKINRIKGIATEVEVIKEGKSLDLIDLGYGVTQFLPILLNVVSGYNLKKGNKVEIPVNLTTLFRFKVTT